MDPVIVYEDSKLPYHGHQFRRMWRIIADKAGAPKTVKNLDSRPRKGGDGNDSDIEEEPEQQ
jgi:hypothetical protein